VNGLSGTSAPTIHSAEAQTQNAAIQQQFREVMAGVATPVAIVTTVCD